MKIKRALVDFAGVVSKLTFPWTISISTKPTKPDFDSDVIGSHYYLKEKKT